MVYYISMPASSSATIGLVATAASGLSMILIIRFAFTGRLRKTLLGTNPVWSAKDKGPDSGKTSRIGHARTGETAPAIASCATSDGLGDQPRAFGTWVPDEAFRYPKIKPVLDLKLEDIEPIPYRPFRWGPKYPINLGIGSMPWDGWLELDKNYYKFMAIRKRRTESRDQKVHRCLPGYLAHAEECLSEICAYLSERYPEAFLTRRMQYVPDMPETYGESIKGKEAGAICSISNRITGETFDFVELRKKEGQRWNPMKYAGLLQQDDLVVMVEDEQGEYRFQAGSTCTAGFWRLEDKIGRTLDEIHTSGNIPQFREKLKFSMERFFQRQKVSAPVQRNNYFFQIDEEIAWSERINGPEDVFDRVAKGPKAHTPEWAAFVPPDPVDQFEKIMFRSERQSLRRMPKTGCILFTIRAYIFPVHEMVKESGVPSRMASAIRSWPEDVTAHKGGPLFMDLLLPTLDRLHTQQIKSGTVQLDGNGEIVGKDIRTYPF